MLMTLCYMEKDNKFLMLYRNKKKNDVNKGKWIGVGGKLEKGEKPEEGILREIKEETNLDAKSCDFRGIVVFNYNDNPSEYMFLYTCNDFSGEIKECDEGQLKWIEKDKLFQLNLWEGDKIFLDLIQKDSKFFYLTLNYNNDELLNYDLVFKEEFTYFEVFVPEEYCDKIIDALGNYDLITEGYYKNAYASIDVEGNWTPLPGADPFDGEIGKKSRAPEKLLKFRVKKEFRELAFQIIKNNHPYEVPVINMINS